MKGLLQKDFYLSIKSCKAYWLVAFVCLGVAFFIRGNFFLIYYPCLMSTMIPVTLLGFDERSKWDMYSATLPYSRAQIVSAKYVIGLIGSGIFVIITAIVQAVAMNRYGSFTLDQYLLIMGTLFCMTLLNMAMILPVLFRYGVEKGRIAYFLMVGVVCGASIVVSFIFDGSTGTQMNFGIGTILAVVAAVAVFAFSWYLSIRFYEKREIK